MRRIAAVLAVVAAAGCCASAGAQSVYGPGGLFANPTAYTPARRQLIWSAIYRRQDMSSAPAPGFHEHDAGVFGLDYGLTDRTEVGLSYTHIRGDIDASPTFGPFVKHVLAKETAERPQVAAGYVWQPNSHWRTQFGFAVASKRLNSPESRRPVHGHVGIMHATFLNHFPTSDFAAYGGLDLALSPGVTLVAEARTKTSADHGTPAALGLVFSLGKQNTLAIGFVNDGAGRDPLLSIGVGYKVKSVD